MFLGCRLSLYLYNCRGAHLSSFIREAFLLTKWKYSQSSTTAQLQEFAPGYMCVLRLTVWDWIIYGWGSLCRRLILLFSAIWDFLYLWVGLHETFLSKLTCLLLFYTFYLDNIVERFHTKMLPVMYKKMLSQSRLLETLALTIFLSLVW